ncbi:MAG: hypothetical protein NTV34_01410 [Proteobacteria bacterium]|nr:hypothetical protein [Pseudomonadota bacterium]
MTRNLFAAEVLEMEATNPAVGTNEHADILSLKGLVPVITWSNA